MKKNLFFLVFTFFAFNMSATKYHHIDENEVRYIKENTVPNTVLQQNLRNQNLWQNFLQYHPNWFVIFNENNLLPHRAFGKPIILTNGSTNADKVLNFIAINNFYALFRFSYFNNLICIITNNIFFRIAVLDNILYFKLSISKFSF